MAKVSTVGVRHDDAEAERSAAARLTPPSVRGPVVDRPDALGQLVDARTPIVSVVAPAGYGKTTLLAQWAERDPKPFAWVGLDERHDDPSALLADVATALRAAGTGRGGRSRRIPMAGPGWSLWSGVRRTVSGLSSMDAFVLVMEDVHRIRHRDSLDVLAAFARNVPAGSVLVFSGRAEPPVPIARLRGLGQITELGVRDLAFDLEQTDQLLRNEGLELSRTAIETLHTRTEGWPAALYLAAMWIKARGPLDDAVLASTNAAIGDFLRDELIARLPRRQLSFLVETSVLDRMCGPLCDAVLETTGSGQMLESLERSNLLVVPLDGRGVWCRYHPMFQEMLRTELDRRSPERVPELLRRAAAWCEENGEAETALRYAAATGDVDRVARLVTANTQPWFLRGMEATVRTWLDWLREHAALERFAPAAILGVMVDAYMGRASEAERWADELERIDPAQPAPDGSESLEPWLAAIRSILGRGGIEQIRADANLASRTIAPDSPLRAFTRVLLGLSLVTDGEVNDAEAAFVDGVQDGQRLGATLSIVVGLSELALLALERGDRVRAQELISMAANVRDREGVAEYPLSALSFGVSARLALHSADVPRARLELARAHRLRPGLTRGFPHLNVQTLLEMASVHVSIADAGGAFTVLRDVDRLLIERPDLGVLPKRAAELRARVETLHVEAQGASSLTTAELRLLPLLSSHLSFREIGDRRSVSPHTVKTQAISIYRKLGVTSRGAAIARAEALGLLHELGSALDRS